MITLETHTIDGRSIAMIAFDRPDKRNALTPEMLVELNTVAKASSADHDAIVLTGKGKAFCAGFDLALCQTTPDGTIMRKLLTGLSAACNTLRLSERPVVIAAQGAAIAGGCAILGGADIVVSNTNAKLGYPVTKIGVSPAISAPYMTQSVTQGIARERLILPDLFSGTTAHQLGLVHELTEEPDDVQPRALEIAAKLAIKPPHAYAATKGLITRLEGDERETRIKQGLETSLGLTGKQEEQRLLGALTF
ncbi:MAG: enoyl-CoA hydratase/isomerase family protein [Phycisphaera sp.]|nr:MAG: enoyl-CoA hydratase/isomerase family protein [Phycisphaera sp.]